MHRRLILKIYISTGLCLTLLAGYLNFSTDRAKAQGFYGPKNSAKTRPRNGSAFSKAKLAFQNKKYTRSISFLKRHLRKNRQDPYGWQLLAANYFHTGLAKKALKILKKHLIKVSDRSFNLYYQGLCFDSIGKSKAFATQMQKAVAAKGSYSAEAAYELGVHFYFKRSAKKATYWLTYYIGKSPRGKFSNAAKKLLASIRQQRPISNPPRMKRPDTEKALYKYNPFSLSDTPNFWMSDFGFETVLETGKEPSAFLLLKERTDTKMGLFLNNSIGLGPLDEGPHSFLFGYTYKQNWQTNQDRIDAYFEDPSDFTYIPFRLDLLEREHQFFADYKSRLSDYMYFGIHTRHERSFIGTNLSSGPEETDIGAKLNLSTTNLAIPWLGLKFSQNFRGLAYWYLLHKVNQNDELFSHKTFELSGESLPISAGFQMTLDLPKYETQFKLDAALLNYIYNDYFEDFDRLTLRFHLLHQIIPDLFLEVTPGYYKDSFKNDSIRIGTCQQPDSSKELIEEATNIGSSFEGQSPVDCPRTDTGLSIAGQIYVNWSQFRRFYASFLYIKNSNSFQRQYEFERTAFTVGISLAFPSVTRVRGYIEHFADKPYAKKEF